MTATRKVSETFVMRVGRTVVSITTDETGLAGPVIDLATLPPRPTKARQLRLF